MSSTWVKPEVLDVVDQVLGQVAVAVVLAPRAEVQLVDAHRTGVRVGLGPALHPGVVLPGVPGVDDRRGAARRQLGGARHRVGLLADLAVGAADEELVERAVTDAGDEELPDPGLAEQAHRVAAGVPAVEVTGDVHGLGPGGPHGERGADDVPHRAGVLADVGAEHGPELLVATLADEVQVDRAQSGREAVRVVLLVLDAVGVGDPQAVVLGLGGPRAQAAPDAVGFVLQLDALAVLEHHRDRGRERAVGADHQAGRLEVMAEQVMGLLVPAVGQRADRLGRGGDDGDRLGLSHERRLGRRGGLGADRGEDLGRWAGSRRRSRLRRAESARAPGSRQSRTPGTAGVSAGASGVSAGVSGASGFSCLDFLPNLGLMTGPSSRRRAAGTRRRWGWSATWGGCAPRRRPRTGPCRAGRR